MEEMLMKEFFRENSRGLNEPIIKDFLKTDENYQILVKAVVYKSLTHKKLLDERFQVFFKKARIIKYVNSLIRFYSIDFDKRIRRVNSRYPLVLNAKPNGATEDITLIDILPSDEADPVKTLLENEGNRLKDVIENQHLHQAINKLSKKQLRIIELIYVNGLTNKEVAKYFDDSPQNISKTHKQALINLRKNVKIFN